MDFYAVLDQIVDLLRRRGRVFYRALQRQFGLDDDYVADLKVELIEVQQVAVDQEGKMLVWLGDAGTPSEPALKPSQSEQPPPTSPPPEAERRQLTVLFCDLADSTRLAQQLDPEDLREVIRAYQAACVTVIQRFDGYVAQYLGDGLVVYFGYPQAHEDDAQRAVRTGLGMLEAMETLNTGLVPDNSVRLAVRMGIHTGLVVVGEMGSGGRHEHLALGDTPNLAARLQSLAAPDTVVMSAATSRLVQGYFTCQDHGTHALKGIDTPIQVYQVVGESAAQSRLDVAGRIGLTPLVGRESELALLRERWAQSTDGLGQVVVLSGPLPPLAIPATLQDALMARLDRLAPVKDVAQLGAVLGREFAYELLRAVAPLDGATVQQALAQLVEAELLYQRGRPPQATYVFKHALIQDAAYQSLLKSTRQQYHQRIAQVLEQQFPETVETQPELLAHHYTEAGLIAQAVGYWQGAGQCAIKRSAYLEAISHLTKGLELLKTLSDTPERVQQELTLYIILGPALRVTKGVAAPEVEAAYHRARELCRQVGKTPQLFPVLRGLVLFYVNRGELQTARELGVQMLSLAQHLQDSARLADAHIMLGNALLFLRELGSARTHLEQGIALYNPQQHHSPGLIDSTLDGVFGFSRLAQILWLLGYPDQALQRCQEALTLAQELSHPIILANAQCFAAILHQYRREVHMTYKWAEAALVLSREQGFAFRLAQATILRGWALVEQGQGEAGIAQIRQGLAAQRATGWVPWNASSHALLAEACGKVGQIEGGLRVIEDMSEVYQLKGELLLMLSSEHQAEAETCFRQALEAARRQQARSLELRAVVSLSRLWQQQGKREEARELLAPVYGWFTEGFDTADLKEAKALLDEWS